MKTYYSAPCWDSAESVYEHQGYSICSLRNEWRGKRAHRIAYEIFYIPIPKGYTLDHLCSNKRCFNPAHLEIVTHSENAKRAWQRDKERPSRKRKTHCRKGHAYTGETNSRGEQICRECMRIADRKRYNKRRNDPNFIAYQRRYQRDYYLAKVSAQ